VVEADRHREVEARLLTGLSQEDRELVRLCVTGAFDSNEAASRLSVKADAVRKRLQRLRPELRARLLAPLKGRVSSRDWALLNTCIVQRMSPQSATELLGCSSETLANSLETLFRDVLSPALGDTGMLALTRLLGKPIP
jgi:hypothetical protein